MARIGKTFTFEAAHRLLRHNGKCRNLHGHSYRVEVIVEGPIQEDTSPDENPQTGMVLDFGKLSAWWARLEPAFDHNTILENTDPLVSILREVGEQVAEWHLTPTAENLAAFFRQDLSQFLIDEAGWTHGFVTPTVRVWETAKSWAEA